MAVRRGNYLGNGNDSAGYDPGRLVWCRHCHVKVGTKPRGLCSACYYDASIRERYPTECSLEMGRRTAAGLRLDATPTSALPGTFEKLAVLCDRFVRGVALFHPQDAGMNDLLR